MTAASNTGTVQHDPVSLKLPVEKKCLLWIHDDAFSKEEVVLNLDIFPDINAGELMAIMALKSDTNVRDFQEKGQGPKKDMENLATAMQQERSSSNPTSPGLINGNDTRHDIDLGKRYLFLAKDMPKEMKAKNTGLEVSVAKHIADVFGFKHRSNVLLTTVSLHTLLIQASVLTKHFRPIPLRVRHLMSNCLSRTSTLLGLICGD